MKHDWDVIVCGGGPAGLGTAAALHAAFSGGLRILVLENAPAEPSDTGRGRVMALSWGSRVACETMELWPALESHTSPIKSVQVSERGRFGAVLLRAEDEQLPALGYTVWSRDLVSLLTDQLGARKGVTLQRPARAVELQARPQGVQLKVEEGGATHTLSARLAVVAEGVHSPLRSGLGILHRQGAAGRHALLAEAVLQDAPTARAGERFLGGGHVALLPWPGAEAAGERLALVLVSSHSQVLEWARQSPEALATTLQDMCGYGWGHFRQVHAGIHHPVQPLIAHEQVRPHIVLMGNAAHTLAPLAAQGYNLALRDAVELARVLAEDAQRGVALGALSSLQEYVRRRHRDQLRTKLFSRGLERVFYSNWPGAGVLRSLGLGLLDVLPPLKSRLLRQAAGLAP